ncbi:hypothetical protein TWF730_010973 [Orbilia blumenaviensis]|uniref:Uncharacterized protein n=1 Tax=Orbilia blumenaviensis TaxID=1796055 RepID=A0AAV9UNI6_9PEZI
MHPPRRFAGISGTLTARGRTKKVQVTITRSQGPHIATLHTLALESQGIEDFFKLGIFTPASAIINIFAIARLASN